MAGADAFTPDKSFILMATGNDIDEWGVNLNGVVTALNNNLAGRFTTGALGATVSLSVDDCNNLLFNFTGALTSDLTIQWPDVGGLYIADNETTGPHSLVLKVGTGASPCVVPQGSALLVFANPDTNAVLPVGAGGSGGTLVLVQLNASTVDIGGVSITGGSGTLDIHGDLMLTGSTIFLDGTDPLADIGGTLFLDGVRVGNPPLVLDCTYGTLTTDNFIMIVPTDTDAVVEEPSAALLFVRGTPTDATIAGIALHGITADYSRQLRGQYPSAYTGTANTVNNPFIVDWLPDTDGNPGAVIAFSESDALLLSPAFSSVNGALTGSFAVNTGDAASGSVTPGSGIDILTDESANILVNDNLTYGYQVFGSAGNSTVQLANGTRAAKVRVWGAGGGGGSGNQIVNGVTIQGVDGADGANTSVTIKTPGSGGTLWLSLEVDGGTAGLGPQIGDIGSQGGAGGVNNSPGTPLDFLNGGGTGGNGRYANWGSFGLLNQWPDGGDGGATADTPGAKGGNAWFDGGTAEWQLTSAESGRGAGGGGGGGLGTPSSVALSHDISGGGGGGSGQYAESPWFKIPPTHQYGGGTFQGVTATISVGAPGDGGEAISPTSNTYSCSYGYSPTEGLDFNFTGDLTITGGTGPTGGTVNVYGIAYENHQTQNASSPLYFWSDIVINGDTVFTGRREETFSTVLTTFPLYFEMIGDSLGTIQADTPPPAPAFGINGAPGLDGQVIIEYLVGAGGY